MIQTPLCPEAHGTGVIPPQRPVRSRDQKNSRAGQPLSTKAKHRDMGHGNDLARGMLCDLLRLGSEVLQAHHRLWHNLSPPYNGWTALLQAVAVASLKQPMGLLMIKRKFGWTQVEVPVVGQGTWMIEGNRAQEERAVAALKLGLHLGLTHIDTAEMYGNGRAEELTAAALGQKRSEVFLVSKVLPSNASYEGTLRACERSLKRLRTSYLDLYLLHWAGRHPIKETMRAMETLVKEGCIRLVGVSNLDLDELKAAQRALRHERLVCNQVLYHLGDRGIERRLVPYCSEQQIAVVAYSPFGHSSFPSSNSNGGRVLANIARKHGRTTRQVVLNFLTRHAEVFTIPKASQDQHVRENSASVGWKLSSSDLQEINQAFPAPDHDGPLGIL